MLFIVAVVIMTIEVDTTQVFSGTVGLIEEVRAAEAGESVPELTKEVKEALIADRFKIADQLSKIRSVGLSRSIKQLLYRTSVLRIHKSARYWNMVLDEKEGVGARGKIPLWENVRSIAPSDTAGTWDKALVRRNALIKAFMR